MRRSAARCAWRLGPPAPRPRRPGLHRPARSGRPGAGLLQPCVDAAGGDEPGGRPRRRDGGARRAAPWSSGRSRREIPRWSRARSRCTSPASRWSAPRRRLPIPVARKEKEDLPAEELRLRHRVLDLRRPELQRNLILRHRLMQATRRYFDGLGFPRDRDADPHQADARGRARLPGAQSGAPGRVLRAAPVAPALQAAAHGGGARSLLPDRPLLPGRGPARRPAAGVHPDRHRGVVRRDRGRARLRRGDGGGPVGRGRPDGRAADSSGCATARRWSGTAATSPTFGSASRSSTPPRCFARPTSRSPARPSPAVDGCAGSGCRAARRSPASRWTRWRPPRRRWARRVCFG